MKSFLFFLLFGILANFVFANEQKESNSPPDSTAAITDRIAASYLIEEGRAFLSEGKTKDALRKFRQAFVRDRYSSKAAYWIAETHYAIKNYGYAIQYGRIATTLSKKPNGDIYFMMAKAYHKNNVIDSAWINYQKAGELLSKKNKNVVNYDALRKTLKFADSVSKIEITWEAKVFSYEINSGYPDYAALLTKDGKRMYFTSRRPDTKGNNLNPQDQEYFEDIYYSDWDEEDEDWTMASNGNEMDRVNSEGFDAIGHVSEDGNRLYLTVNTSILGGKEATRGSDIFTVEYNVKSERWNKPKPIDNKSINTSFFDGAPTLTADELTMYFVSDRDGSKTKTDIYEVRKVGNAWGVAKKLPMNVNTVGNETTPFITPDGRFLFFSSDGHLGMGGYDFFVTEKKGDTWTDPINLGPNFNTVNDEIYFRYYPDFKKALFSKDRIQGNKSSLDIFEVDVHGWEIPTK